MCLGNMVAMPLKGNAQITHALIILHLTDEITLHLTSPIL